MFEMTPQKDFQVRTAITPEEFEPGAFRIIRGKTEILTRNKLLADFAADLAVGLPDDCAIEAKVIVGIHLWRFAPKDDRPLIGIQTEHILSEEKNEMRLALDRRTIRQVCAHYDAILDLSELSRPAYSHINEWRQRKVTYGPHIFPSKSVSYNAGGKSAVFVGGLNNRRQEIIDLYQSLHPVEIVPRGTYGIQLEEFVNSSSLFLNIHFQEGTVSEAPRLLKAYLYGKPTASEDLAAPFIIGRHCLSLSELPSLMRMEEVFSMFEKEIASQYRFIDYLSAVTGGKAA